MRFFNRWITWLKTRIDDISCLVTWTLSFCKPKTNLWWYQQNNINLLIKSSSTGLLVYHPQHYAQWILICFSFCEILDHITTMSYYIMLCFAQKICFVVNFKGLIKDSEKYFFQFSYDFVRALVLVNLHCKQNFFKICHVHLIYLLVVSIGILMITLKKILKQTRIFP